MRVHRKSPGERARSLRDLFGNAAEQQALETMAAMRGDDQQVFRCGGIGQLPRRQTGADLACHPQALVPQRLLHRFQIPGGLFLLANHFLGKLGASRMQGVHFEEADEISIEGEGTNLILDGEMFRTQIGRPIVLKPAAPLSFVRLAA